MKFARWSFLIAGIWGILVLTPLYFLETKTGIDHPPEITHPEYYYGFVGVALAWQVLFLIIARDPQSFRLVMLPATIEKFSFVISTYALYALGRVDSTMVAAASADLVLGILFVISFFKTGHEDYCVVEGRINICGTGASPVTAAAEPLPRAAVPHSQVDFRTGAMRFPL